MDPYSLFLTLNVSLVVNGPGMLEGETPAGPYSSNGVEIRRSFYGAPGDFRGARFQGGTRFVAMMKGNVIVEIIH